MSVVVLTGDSDSSTVETDTEDDEDIRNASATRSKDTSNHEGTPAIAALNNQPAAACAAAASILGGEDVEHTPVLLTVQTQMSRGEMDILVVQLQGKVALLQQRMYDMERSNQRMKRALDEASRRSVVTDPATDPVGSDKTFKEEVVDVINHIMRKYSRWSSKRKGALVAKAVWDHNECVPELVKLSRRYFRANVFTPFNILREMDLAGGTLSYEGIDCCCVY